MSRNLFLPVEADAHETRDATRTEGSHRTFARQRTRKRAALCLGRRFVARQIRTSLQNRSAANNRPDCAAASEHRFSAIM